MFDRRHLAASILGVLLVAPLTPSGAQEKQPDPKPAPKTESKPGKAPVEASEHLQHLLKAMNGGVIILVDDPPHAAKDKPGAPAEALEKALKQLSGPAEQLDLREVRKLIAQALADMKTKSGDNFRVDVGGGLRIAVPPLGPNPASAAQVVQDARVEQMQKHIEMLVQQLEELKRVGAPGKERRTEQELEQARRALDTAIAEKAAVRTEKKTSQTAPANAIPVQFIMRFANEPVNENLTLTRRAGRYVARLIEPGVRITVTGPIQAAPQGGDTIIIEAGEDVSSYANVAAVPERYRASVARLLDLARR
jgi:hypothetical protein